MTSDVLSEYGVLENGIDSPSDAQHDQVRIRVLVVDDHEISAHGVRQVLDSFPDVEVVGEVGTVKDAVDWSARLQPDVVIMDYMLADGDGVTAVELIKRDRPSTQVVMLTGAGDDDRIARRAFEVGCSGFLGKARSVDDLIGAVRAAYSGDVLITPSMLLRLIPRNGRVDQGLGARLSRREREVLAAMAEGGTDKDIAKQLFVSLNTARKHTQNILRKLGAHSKLEAVVIALREGIIRPL